MICVSTHPVNATAAIAAEVLKKYCALDAARLFGAMILQVVHANAFVADTQGSDATKITVSVGCGLM